MSLNSLFNFSTEICIKINSKGFINQIALKLKSIQMWEQFMHEYELSWSVVCGGMSMRVIADIAFPSYYAKMYSKNVSSQFNDRGKFISFNLFSCFENWGLWSNIINDLG